MESKKKWVEGP